MVPKAPFLSFLRITLLGFLFATPPSFLYSQEWEVLAPELPDQRFNDLHVISQDTMVAVGRNGIFVQTNDGGASWDVQYNIGGSESKLNAVHFQGVEKGWTVGSEGTLLRTRDGGRSWSDYSVNPFFHLQDVQFLNDSLGWVLGDDGLFLHSKDGGTTWKRKYWKDEALNGWKIRDFNFLDPQKGWVLWSESELKKGEDWESKDLITRNAGRSWSPVSSEKLSDEGFPFSHGFSKEIQFGGYIKISGRSIKVEDTYFLNSGEGWAVGEDANIFHIAPGAEEWEVQSDSVKKKLRRSNNTFQAVEFLNDSIGWIVGYGVILKTLDGGDHWKIIRDKGPSRPFYGADFTSPSEGWVSSSRFIYRTDNGGEDWKRTQWETDREKHLTDLEFIGPDKAWVVGASNRIGPHRYNGGSPFIFHTDDGGKTWKEQSFPDPADLLAVDFLDSLKGWATGANGTIIRTRDGGKNWERLDLDYLGTKATHGSSDNLKDVFFLDEDHGWIVGSHNTILKTEDAGKSWSLIKGLETDYEDSRKVTFNSVFFLNTQDGWCVGDRGLVLKTDNGGETWNLLDKSFESDLNDVLFLEDSSGFIVGREKILSSDDLGHTWKIHKRTPKSRYFTLESFEQKREKNFWQRIGALNTPREWKVWAFGENGTALRHLSQETLDRKNDKKKEKTKSIGLSSKSSPGGDWRIQHPQHPIVSINDLHLIDRNKAVAVGYQGTVLRTEDGGASWESVPNPISPLGLPDQDAEDLNEVIFKEGGKGWILGNTGILLHSKDAGQSWDTLPVPQTNYLRKLQFYDHEQGWMLGGRNTQTRIFKTRNGGRSWTPIRSDGLPEQVKDLHFFNEQEALILGEEYVHRTGDGGRTWKKLALVSSGMNKFEFVDQDNGWLFGDRERLLRTENGGKTWDTLTLGLELDRNSISFLNKERGVAVGRGRPNKILYLTEDGGKSWEKKELPSTVVKKLNFLSGLHYQHKEKLYFWGHKGTLLSTDGTFDNWSFDPPLTLNSLNAVHFPDRSNGWVVGSEGVVLHTGNGGETWKKQKTGIDQDLVSVHFLDKHKGWSVARGGVLLYTEDGGRNWETLNPPPGKNLKKVLFTDPRVGYVLAYDQLFKTKDGGKTWESLISDRGSLEGMQFIGRDTIYLLEGERLFISKNGGKGWSTYRFEDYGHPYNARFSSFHVNDPANIWGISQEGVDPIASEFCFCDPEYKGDKPTNSKTIEFPSPKKGWAAGKSGTIIRTEDGGLSWKKEITPTVKQLNDIHFVSDEEGWVVGEQGTILHRGSIE